MRLLINGKIYYVKVALSEVADQAQEGKKYELKFQLPCSAFSEVESHFHERVEALVKQALENAAPVDLEVKYIEISGHHQGDKYFNFNIDLVLYKDNYFEGDKMKLIIDGKVYYFDAKAEQRTESPFLYDVTITTPATVINPAVQRSGLSMDNLMHQAVFAVMPRDVHMSLGKQPQETIYSGDDIRFTFIMQYSKKGETQKAFEVWLQYGCMHEIEKQLAIHHKVFREYQELKSRGYFIGRRNLDKYVAQHLEELREYKLLRRIIKTKINIEQGQSSVEDLKAAIKKYKDFCEEAHLPRDKRIWNLLTGGFFSSPLTHGSLAAVLSGAGFIYGVKLALAALAIPLGIIFSPLFFAGLLIILAAGLLIGFASYAYQVKQANLALLKRNYFIEALEEMTAKMAHEQHSELKKEEKEEEKLEKDKIQPDQSKDKKDEENSSRKETILKTAFNAKYSMWSSEEIQYKPGEKPHSWSPTKINFNF